MFSNLTPSQKVLTGNRIRMTDKQRAEQIVTHHFGLHTAMHRAEVIDVLAQALGEYTAEIDAAHAEMDEHTARYRKCDGYPTATLVQRVRDICIQLRQMTDAYRQLREGQ